MTTMLGSTRVVSQIDDDFLRRLIYGIEYVCTAFADEYGHGDEKNPVGDVEWAMDGDYFLAYLRARNMMKESYPDQYPATEDEGV